MTNTQQMILGQVSSSEQPQEDIEFTELLPVEHSRIKDTTSDKDIDTTDGLKVIRSFTDINIEDLKSQGYTFISNLDDDDDDDVDEDDDDDDADIDQGESEESETNSRKRVYDDEDDGMNSTDKIKSQKIENKNEINNLVQQTNKNFQKSDEKYGTDCSKSITIKKQIAKKNIKIHEDIILPKNAVILSVKKEEEEKDLRSNIDVIIEASYLLEQENNNSGIGSVKESDKPTESVIEKKNSTPMIKTIKTPAAKNETKDTQSLKTYKCMMCDARFKGSGGLRNHYKVVHSTGPLFKCDDCGKEFPLKERLKLHVRTHTGFKPYKCTECDKCFARGGQLVQHKRTHSLIKPYQCNLCTHRFTCAANLTLHMKRHTGQKDHKCSICGKGFIRRDALKKHLECLHNDVKSFLCIICNKTFKGHLPQHMRTHAHDRPHACPTCGQKFAQKSQLTVHQRTHNGQRPFRCLVCWQAFAHSTALKLHTRRHTGERPFKCTECNVGFTQLPHWKKHMKCIHKRSKPYSCKNCNNFFKKKNDLENHEKTCVNDDDDDDESRDEYLKADGISSSRGSGKLKLMNLERMRLLLAVLLKRISKPEKLDELGFGKRLIDEIIVDSLTAAGKQPIKKPSKIGKLTELEMLRKNLEMFLEWTVPKEHWEIFKKMDKTPEEILETLTTT